ncbi:MAG TPA: DUF4190 domain-containing protein [Candidatus Dormibacteraeota bacterium]|nr:DUF4190 domain-containing protein [Candidatus Dormibacteraeota bacterium]
MSTFCLGCGNSVTEGERYCAVCGRDLQAGADVPRIDPQVAFGLPPETSGKAIFSLICGILFFFLPFSIIAVIFGYLALSEIRRNPGRLTGKWLAITGIVLGYVGVACIVGFIGLMIYEVRKEAKQMSQAGQNVYAAASENSVVSSVRTLNTAEIAYSSAHHDLGYTCSIPELKKAWGLSADLARGKKNGYVFELQDCAAAKPFGPIVKYRLMAYPEANGKARLPAYCSDESDVIRVSRNGSAQDCLRAGVDLSESDVTHPKD